ncbi:unnamed protein product [Allacma fusca]|uniref:Transposase n=1 Tax=Allacma fusca TaxID=39272 RepID=A0A8J2PPE6_9HEXA|nr:unnamed protein product [Allacma fusca]
MRNFQEDYGTIKDMKSFNDLVDYTSPLKPYSGVPGYESIPKCSKGIKMNGTWYSKICKPVNSNTCGNCLKLKQTLKVYYCRQKKRESIIYRLKSTPSSPSQSSTYVKLKKYLAKANHKLKNFNTKLKGEKLALKLMQNNFQNNKLQNILDNIDACTDLHSNTKTVLKESVKVAQAELDKQGAIIFVEMKVRERLSFNAQTMEFDGFIDYGDSDDCIKPQKKGSVLADHALVLLFRPFNAKWPIGSFAAKGATPGDILAKLLIAAIVQFENIGAQVNAVISDAATTNRNVWARLGIHGDVGKPIQNKLIFSKSVADAIQFYRKQGLVGLENSEGTELFTRTINDVFDAHNIRFKGITTDSIEIKVLKETERLFYI